VKLYRLFFSSVLLLATTIGVQAQTYYCCTPCCAPPPPPCCYEVEPKQRAPGVVFEATVLFDSGSYSLNADAKERLFVAARELREQYADELVIAGHTDSRGSEASNEVLALQRAIAVKNYLAGAGVSVSRMLAFGFGERQPVATNATSEGRARNRRVVINIKQQ
jgi:outer membrane protein OmpA-like peptidoglycan-associated protein